jgi:hypothetical protein
VIARSQQFKPSQPDLQTRVANRKQELIAELIEHKKSSRSGAPQAIEMLSARLTDLVQIMKGVGSGWTNVEHGAKAKLDAWVAR